jgi:serine/threonine protein kinase
MKKIIVTSEKDIKKIEKEYQILIDLNLNAQNDKDLNLVKIYGFSSKKLDPTTYVIYVLMELAITDWENEILKRQKTKKYYTEKELMTILSSLINTFADLQKQNISHRDIKPQNILIFKDNKYKLADFGEAKELYKDIAPTNKQTLRGTELYMAPALFYALRSKKVIKYINHNPYKSDVFSFGLCSLFAATLCFESIYDIRELKNNVSIHVILEKYLRKHYSYDVINIISHMLDINETTRKDFIEMKEEFKLYGFN